MYMVVGEANGQPSNLHLRNHQPNALHSSYAQHDDCIGSYESVMDNEFAQARIKRLEVSDYEIDELVFSVDLSCLKSDLFYVFVIDAKFGKVTRVHSVTETDSIATSVLDSLRVMIPDSVSSVLDSIAGPTRELIRITSPTVVVSYEPGYNRFGIAPVDRAEEYIRNNMRKVIEEALTDYLKANFDL